MEDGNAMIDILYEDNHLLGVVKPCNMPVQQDESQDEDLLTVCKAYIKEKYQKPGNVYLGLVHRLDRPVGGCMVFAKTSKAASRLSNLIREQKMEKTYYAIIDGILKEKQGTFIDYLKKDTSKNRVTVTNKEDGKKSILDYTVIQEKNGMSLVKIALQTGRSHQIRVQFSSRNVPIVNDQRYHPNPKKGQIALYCVDLKFKHPVKEEEVQLETTLPNTWPWIEFEVKSNE